MGGAIDQYTLNHLFFTQKQVPVLGTILNFGKLTGFSSAASNSEYVSKWFANNMRRDRFYGIVPTCTELEGLRERIEETDSV